MYKNKWSVCVILALLFYVAGISSSRAELFISPLRVVFENRDRSATVTLMNTATEYKTYRIGWKFMRMKENGQYEQLEKSEQTLLDFEKAVRFSPRQTTIAPQAQQSIRLSLRRPADLPDGEYRAHMTFTRLAKTESPNNEQAAGAKLQLNVNIEFSIPIIVRQGAGGGDVNLTDVSYVAPDEKNGSRVQIILTHDGKFSSYGRLRVMDGEKEVAVLNNVALYPEIKRRVNILPFINDKYKSIKGLKVLYEGMGEFRGKMLAQKQF